MPRVKVVSCQLLSEFIALSLGIDTSHAYGSLHKSRECGCSEHLLRLQPKLLQLHPLPRPALGMPQCGLPWQDHIGPLPTLPTIQKLKATSPTFIPMADAKLMQRILDHWRRLVRINRIAKRVFVTWRAFTIDRAKSRRIIKVWKTFVLCKQIFRHWRTKVTKRRVCTVLILMRKKNQIIRRWVLNIWRRFVARKKQQFKKPKKLKKKGRLTKLKPLTSVEIIHVRPIVQKWRLRIVRKQLIALGEKQHLLRVAMSFASQFLQDYFVFIATFEKQGGTLSSELKDFLTAVIFVLSPPSNLFPAFDDGRLPMWNKIVMGMGVKIKQVKFRLILHYLVQTQPRLLHTQEGLLMLDLCILGMDAFLASMEIYQQKAELFAKLVEAPIVFKLIQRVYGYEHRGISRSRICSWIRTNDHFPRCMFMLPYNIAESMVKVWLNLTGRFKKILPLLDTMVDNGIFVPYN